MSFYFQNKTKESLYGEISMPDSHNDIFILFCHGFPSSSAGSTAQNVLTSFPLLGYPTMVFDFSGAHRSEGDFSEKLMSKELDDITAAVDHIEGTYSPKHIVLMGHSTGAIDAALYGHTDPRLSAVIIMAGVSHLDQAVRYDFSDRMVRDFWEQGYVTYDRPDREWIHGQVLKKAFYDEFFHLDIPKAISLLRTPLLIVHGEYDSGIPMNKDPLELFEMANHPKELAIIPRAGHSFKEEGAWEKVVCKTDLFLRQHLIHHLKHHLQ